MSAPAQERQISGHSWRPGAYNEQRSRLGRRSVGEGGSPPFLCKGRLCFVGWRYRSLLFMLLVTATDITVWIVSALLALGIGLSKYAKWKARNQLVRELAAMDRERREKMLSRMNPEQAMEARQELMRRFNIF